MTAFADIDLGKLPAPDLVETLDFEAIYAAAVADLQALWPQWDALVESDPAVKLLQVFAYRELVLRQRVNDAARATHLAFAEGSNLDHIAALFGVARAVATPADPNAVPPVAAVLEDDARLRRRVQLALEASTAAGTSGRYAFFAMGADARVADVAVASPFPGAVDVTILVDPAHEAEAAAVLAAVDAKLQAEDVRTLTDTVFTRLAVERPYSVAAELSLAPGAGQQTALDAASAALSAYTAERYRIGRMVPRSALIAALHVEGVERVALASPAADIDTARFEVARPNALTVAAESADG
ncbi:MAG: baseplate J/gp47 family protein [Pseudomonadota bacterium]